MTTTQKNRVRRELPPRARISAVSLLLGALLTATGCSDGSGGSGGPGGPAIAQPPAPPYPSSPDPAYTIPRHGVYADTEWAAAHGGPRNNDVIDIDVLPMKYREKFVVSEGSVVLLGPSAGPDGTLYFTNGSDHTTPNLYAYHQDGSLRWASEAWNDGEGNPDPDKLDACALWNPPIIDKDGDVYVGDCNQFWAFHADGSLKWVIDLPPAPEGAPYQDLDSPVNSFGGAFFTNDGYAGGITFWGDVVIVDRATGELVAPVANMPGAVTFVEDIPPPGVDQPHLNAHGYGLAVWNFFQGHVESSNVPAVHPTNGRIYATGYSSVVPEEGALHGFRLQPTGPGESLEIVFDYEFLQGPRSGSSPAISPDGRTIYISEGGGTTGDGVIRSLNVEDDSPASENWRNSTGLLPSSATVGPEGNIYVFSLDRVESLDPATGQPNWTVYGVDIAEPRVADLEPNSVTTAPGLDITAGMTGERAQLLDLQPGEIVRVHLDGKSSLPNGIPAIAAGLVNQPLALGYRGTLKVYQSDGVTPVDPPRELNIPILAVRQVIVQIDVDSGEVVDVVYSQGDTNGGFVVPYKNGLLTASRGAIASGTTQPSAALIDAFTPETAMTPIGGLEIAEGIDDITVGEDISAAIDSGYIAVYTDAGPGGFAAGGEAVLDDRDIHISISRNGDGEGMTGTITVGQRAYTVTSGEYSGYKGITGTASYEGQGGTTTVAFVINDWSNETIQPE